MNDRNRTKPCELPVHEASAMAAGLCVICFVAFFNGLFTLAPLDKTEALQIGIAQTMQRMGEWGVPHWNGHLYSDKPPLPYWLASLAWKHFGLIPELARIPASLAATIGVAGLTWFTHLAYRQKQLPQQSWRQAALAGSLLALSPGWIAFGRTAVHDIYLALAVMLALGGYALCFGLMHERRRVLLGAFWIGLCCGVGFLAKGLLGIGLPLLVIAMDATLNPISRRDLLRPAATAMFIGGLLAVVSPWAAELIQGRHWAYLEGFLGFSHLERATQAVDGHDQPFFFYLPVLMALLLPWWPMLLTAFQQLWKRRRDWQQASAGIQRLQQLAAACLVLGIALFSTIPTKLPGYILPLVPSAVFLISTSTGQPRWCVHLMALQLALLSAALLLGLIGSHFDLMGTYGQLLLATTGGWIWIALGGGILALAAALYAGWRAKASQQLPALLISMLLVVSCLPVLASPYRQLEQEPILELARAAYELHGKPKALYVLGRPRYSVVAEAQLPTIFGSPLKAPRSRPDSSFKNWELHADDPEALVLGRCSSVQALEQAPSTRISVLEQRSNTCLAQLQRTTGQP